MRICHLVAQMKKIVKATRSTRRLPQQMPAREFDTVAVLTKLTTINDDESEHHELHSLKQMIEDSFQKFNRVNINALTKLSTMSMNEDSIFIPLRYTQQDKFDSLVSQIEKQTDELYEQIGRADAVDRRSMYILRKLGALGGRLTRMNSLQCDSDSD